MTDFNQCVFPVKILNRKEYEFIELGITKLEYATFEILKSPHIDQSYEDKEVVSRAIKLAKEALKQLAKEH